jgi:uncharacterized protein
VVLAVPISRDWADVVKQLWDEDSVAGTPLRVMLLGSSPLLVRKGLSDSLAGRFEVIRVTHWTFSEMRDAFGWDLDTYLFYGGYPGAAPLIKHHDRWEEYILDAIVETNLSRDILMLNRVEKPALLRQLFRLACTYSGQVLSYTKMLGTLTDAGNTVTLAHYLELLGGAGMVTGLAKYSGSPARRRGSSPKLLALNTALVSATARTTFAKARGGNLHEPRLGLQHRNIAASDVPHPGAQAANELMDIIGERTPVGHLPLNAFGHQFLHIRDIGLPIAVPASLSHGADGPHAAV